MYRNIIVPLDGSVAAEEALPVAAGIARRSGSKMTVVHALDFTRADYPGIPETPDSVGENLYDRAAHYLDTVANHVRTTWKVAVDTVLIETDPHTALAHSVPANHADLIVMTTHGRGPFERFWLGSVADRLVREAYGQVLLVRPGTHADAAHADQPYAHILVSVDGSENSERAVPLAAELARVSAARITLLHVATPVLVGAPLDAETADADESRDYLERLANGVRLVCRDVHTETIHTPGPVAMQILDYAKQNGVDLIAIATHGNGCVHRFLIGSVADKIIRASDVPVLVVKARV